MERSDSDLLVDLHVYIMPTWLWEERLNSAINHIASEAISAGFIRVFPETTIANLRDEIEIQIGRGVLPENYIVLRCVGRCFTRLKPKQEKLLKVKHFIPPQTKAPELFVLEAALFYGDLQWAASSETGRTALMSQSSSSPSSRLLLIDQRTLPVRKIIPPIDDNSKSRQTAGIERHIPNGLVYGLDRTCHRSNSSTLHQPIVIYKSITSRVINHENFDSKESQTVPESELLLNSSPIANDNGTESETRQHGELVRTQRKVEEDEEELVRNEEQDLELRRTADYLTRQEAAAVHVKLVSKDGAITVDDMSRIQGQQKIEDEWAKFSEEKRSLREQKVNDDGEKRLRLEAEKNLIADERAGLLEQIEELKFRRQQAEQIREDLKNRVRQMQSKVPRDNVANRNAWKKKYFEEKRKTVPLDEQSHRLRRELEEMNNRILTLMKNNGRKDGNNLRIQVVKYRQEIDSIQRQIADVSVKLMAEIKLRKQVEQEVRMMKTELTQRKSLVRNRQDAAARFNPTSPVEVTSLQPAELIPNKRLTNTNTN